MISSLTYFVALDQGYFLDEGIRVNGVPIPTSNKIADSLEVGDIDIAIELSVVPLLQQLDSATSPSAFMIFSASEITSENGFDSVLVNESSPYQTLGDLTGKRIAVFPGTTAQSTLKDVFGRDYANLPPPLVFPTDPSRHLAMLETGEVDAIHAYEPYLSIGLEDRGMRRVHTSIYASQLSPNPIGVAAVNRNWHRSNTDSAEKAIRALDRAADFIRRYPDKARMIASNYTNTEPHIARAMNIMPMSVSTAIPIEQLDAYISILHEIGEVPSTPKANAICMPQK